jgi:hypothetical protein
MSSAVLWFFGGAITFQVLSRILKAGQLVRLSIEVGASLLVLAASVDEDINFARDLKYKKLKEDGVTGTDMELIKEMDDRAIAAWRQGVIFKFQNSMPQSMQGVFKFRDWGDAMRFMRKNMKNR